MSPLIEIPSLLLHTDQQVSFFLGVFLIEFYKVISSGPMSTSTLYMSLLI